MAVQRVIAKVDNVYEFRSFAAAASEESKYIRVVKSGEVPIVQASMNDVRFEWGLILEVMKERG